MINIKSGKVLLLIWIFGLIVISQLSPKFISQTSFTGGSNSFDVRLPQWLYDDKMPRWIWMWANLDGNHYLSIARDGYRGFEHGFFPFYPIAIRLIVELTSLPTLVSGLIVSYISFIGLLIIFRKILRLDFSAALTNSILIWFISFPTSFFLISVYNDSLYLLLAFSSIYLSRNNKWLLAGTIGYLAALTRITGIALFLFLLAEAVMSKRNVVRKVASTFLVPLGTLSYFAYLQFVEGSWKLFFDSMKIWDQDRLIFPLQTLWRYLKILVGFHTFDRPYLVAIVELSTVLLSMFLLYKGWRLIRKSYVIYTAAVLLLPATSGTLSGMPRYFIHAFPLIIILSLVTANKPYAKILMLIFVIIQSILFAYFSQGQFVS